MRKELAMYAAKKEAEKEWERDYRPKETEMAKAYTNTANTMLQTELGRELLSKAANNDLAYNKSLDLTNTVVSGEHSYEELKNLYYGDTSDTDIIKALGFETADITTLGYKSAGEFVSAFKSGFEELDINSLIS
jgi:hypothetical protein